MHISAGSKVRSQLSDSKINSLAEELLSYINQNRLEDGFFFIAEELRSALQGILSPAKILLIIGMALSIVAAAFLSYFLFAGERDLNVWGSEQPMKTIEWLVYLLTGVWIAKATVMFSMYTSHKFPYAGVGLGVLVAVGLFAFYVLDMLTVDENTQL